jgi:hypothetical protein
MANIIRKITAAVAAVVMLATGSLALASEVRRLPAYNTQVWYAQVYEGQLAEVLVRGDGRADIDVYVYDYRGHLVAGDDDDTATCLARWIPTYTGVVRIEVRNTSGLFSDYALDVAGAILR